MIKGATKVSFVKTVKGEEMKHITIYPGDHYVSKQNVLVSTLLGSCVSACLYDPVTRIIGMNHFLLSSKRYAKDMPVHLTEAGRYGVHAMELVINDMLKLGAKRNNLKAKAFGGGAVLGTAHGPDNFLCVGEVNCRFIVEFLKNDGIPLVSYDLGGQTGRVIRFSSHDFSVLVRKIKVTTTSKLVQKEKQYWKKTMDQKEPETLEPELWG
ncbi:MAG: Chemoreceptor glutamine deamidase CheD [Syntrophorhabdus sp. PtaU1.Bin002]|nr:MAG: Chemoreceptor glutamine deamidase CheD [Syntrophorhabdus sp. PtaB.Bin006]OPY66564.1 MAG: Chemoreceptor glutamine deamidase CheD [Syntrophorhabdus sp. PtaU1.Bin002]